MLSHFTEIKFLPVARIGPTISQQLLNTGIQAYTKGKRPDKQVSLCVAGGGVLAAVAAWWGLALKEQLPEPDGVYWGARLNSHEGSRRSA